MADQLFASVVNQKTIVQVQLQVLALITAQVTNVISAQIGISPQIDPDVIDI